MFSSCLFMTIALAAPGCAMDADDAQVDDGAFAVPLDVMGGFGDPHDLPPGTGNGFLPKCFWNQHTLAAYRLYSQKALWRDYTAGDYSLLPNAEIDQLDADCRLQALKYLARCALRKDTYFIDPLTGEKVPGWLGVTDEWATARLSSDDEWWFTSCITQHLNGFGQEVDLKVSGGVAMKSMLWDASVEDLEYTLHDSHTYGNLFNTPDRFVINVCFDRDLIDQCNEINTVTTRICDTDPSIGCGLNITGPCESACTWSMTMGAYSCGSAGYRNIGSLLKTVKTYGSVCEPVDRRTPTRPFSL